MPNECCGFCKQYEHVDDGITFYRGHRVQIGYCPRVETLEELDKEAETIKTRMNWDEAYRWTTHTACNNFELDMDKFNEPYYQWIKNI